MLTFKRILVVVCCLGMLLLPSTTSAASTASSTSSSSNSATQAVTQGYATDTPLQKGMIVKLKDNDSTKVEPLTVNTVSQMQGVVVAANDATVTLSSDANTGQVFVATFGHYDVLVSNQNGPIKKGDFITISSLAGVGMKVDTTQSVVLGRATAAFNGTGNVESTAKLKQAGGGELTVSIARIPVDISVSHNPFQQNADRGLQGVLNRVSTQIAGKEVGTSRAYIALVALALAAMLSGGMLYSGIRGGLIAIGRNPLAKQSVLNGIFRVVVAGLIVFMIGLFGVYLILKL